MWFDVGICPIRDVRRLTESMVRGELLAAVQGGGNRESRENVSAGWHF